MLLVQDGIATDELAFTKQRRFLCNVPTRSVKSELLRLFFSATHAGKRNTEHFLSTSNGNTEVRAATCQKLTVSRTRHVEAGVQPHVFIISRQDFFRVRRKARGNSTTGKKSAERMCVYITSVQNVIICRNG